MSQKNDSFDLFDRRPGWKAEAVLVLTPYVEPTFFTTLARSLKPKQLSVVIDDGCRPDDVKMVTEAVSAAGGRTARGLRCVLGSATGLMHLKLFYIRWQTPGKRTARTLIFGSANATRQGFGGVTNAELIASHRLTSTRHSAIIDWCEQVMAATGANQPAPILAARDLELAKGAKLRLPALTVGRRSFAPLTSFDLWLQRGWLLSAYRPDPSFLRIPIHLAKSLNQTDQQMRAASSGFFVPATKSLNFPYALPAGHSGSDDDHHPDDDGDTDTSNWRRRYFVWTQLGDWCSEACYNDESGQFRRKGHELRAQRLQCLEALRSPEALKIERDRYLGALDRLWTDFGDEAGALLRGKGGLDVDFYIELFGQRIERDLARIRDKEFIDRYLRGYELSPVPRFRTDVRGWSDFVDSAVRQLCLDNLSARNQSWLLTGVRDAIGDIADDGTIFDDPERLRDTLRALFRSAEGGDVGAAETVARITSYHQE